MEVIYHNTDEALLKYYGISGSVIQVRCSLKLNSSAISRDVGHDDSQARFPFIWPDCEELQKTMPLCLRATYGSKVVGIIDCHEIKIERPSNLLAKGSTWFLYKHANTVKVLIAVAPQGVTTFVSERWGCCTSDKHLTWQSGLLKKLYLGDILFADS